MRASFSSGADETGFSSAMTIGFKIESRELLVEVPLDREPNFIMLNSPMLLEDGKLTYIRKMFEVVNGKKLR